MKRREGRGGGGGGMGRRDFGRSANRRGGGKEEGKKENPSTPRATFLRIQGNRFRERKGAALIALPARSRGLGTRSFFLLPLASSSPFPPPILFLSPAAFSRQTRYFDRATCPNGSQRVQRWPKDRQMGNGNQFSRFVLPERVIL